MQAHSDNAAAFVGQRLGGTTGEKFMSLAVVLSVLATTQVAIIGTARLIFSMSRDRVLPATLACHQRELPHAGLHDVMAWRDA